MAPKLPTTLLRRPCLSASASSTSPSSSPATTTLQAQQVRHATFVPRSRRPYTFTQLVQLSDGSTYTMRTTSPAAIFRSTRDTRNHAMWQPSDPSLRNVEVDEAGKLAAFRARFGRSWDVDVAESKEEVEASGAEKKEDEGMDYDTFADLISGYAVKEGGSKSGGGLSAKEQARLDKKKK
ncbi:hypothetical protein CONLIGDRAFT_631559 [Coniochaeta ligniaria NRRL 30616]|uniref:Ribosomal protein bL31m N-terminal domain-containing protein n=1 Tax=Coniochaeta ligniaria NRRL 30616 TaxID=1408157 RepID=A0A1J7IQ40_9PEZI|nr:hypothetical protein CONLIGDRAFT_631559 [Coniochaeta ligniaria NRRL 30616]